MYKKLSKNDCQNILGFFEQILVPAEMFRKQVLISLSQLFGYHRSIFWLSNKDGRLYDPVALNLKDGQLNDYVDHFAELDVLHPQKKFDQYCKNNVLRINDVMPFNQYESTEYYNEFMRRHGEYYEMGVVLLAGTKLLGGIGFARSKDEKAFNTTDIRRLSVISKQLSNTLANNYLLEDYQFQSMLLEDQSHMSSIGMIVLEYPSRVRYVNSVARDICSELTPKSEPKNPVSYFAENFLSANFPNWQLGLEITLLLPSFQEVTAHIKPVVDAKASVNLKQYVVYLVPKNMASTQSFTRDEMQCHLTSKEREVCLLVQKGLSNSEIANEMFISVNTVKSHLKSLFKKMNVNNRTQLCYQLEEKLKSLP